MGKGEFKLGLRSFGEKNRFKHLGMNNERRRSWKYDVGGWRQKGRRARNEFTG
jgi:hypothetical protein